MIAVSTPRRRCVGSTPTTVTPAARSSPPGNRQLERVRARAADRLAVVERGVHALDREDRREALHALLVGLEAPKYCPIGASAAPELLERGRPDLDRHQAIFSSGA